MSNEFEKLDLDVRQSEPAPRRHHQVVLPQLYMLVAILLAVACAYLVLLHSENRALIQLLQNQKQRARDQYEKLRSPSKAARKALTELADHAANEAELHRSRGNREQALADIAHARHLLSLAQKLATCVDCSAREVKPIDAKLTKLIDKLQPTQEETARLEPPTDSLTPGRAPEEKSSKREPEQSEISGSNNSGGESDA